MSLKRKPSRQKTFVSSLAMMVGISLAMNPFCVQAQADKERRLGSPESDNHAPEVHPKLWPESKSPIGLDARIEERINGLLQRMTVEEKVGQVIQPEWKSISPAEVAQYHIGSIENGGGAVVGMHLDTVPRIVGCHDGLRAGVDGLGIADRVQPDQIGFGDK